MRKITTILLLLCLSARLMQAQIVIGGHVYGGGNAGDTGGSTTVTIREGNLNRVFGGARMADVKGRAFTNIDGANASSYIVINRLYGGNDIAGTIGKSREELPDAIKTHAAINKVDTTWNALLLISTKTNLDGTEAADAQKIYIGQLFGGGDGEYEYGSTTEGGKTVYYAKEDGVEVATSNHELTPPNIGKTFLDIHGGSIVYAYGGGNNATVTERTVISLDNPSKVVNSIKDTRITTEGDGELLTNERFEEDMGINTTFSYPSSDAFQIGRLFGGNNKADMAIRPRWNLQRGSVRNLYGGGNEGRMTSPEGLLLQIAGVGMTVDNVYGGCRKADVKPLYDGDETRPVPYDKVALDPTDNPNNIPAGYAARVRVLAGHVKNVYGGNDISGNVYGGNTVGIFTHIYGDVYGGGNGSYAYTDNAQLQGDPRWGDFYYNPKEILDLTGNTFTGMQSAEALNLFRPNAEKVSILVRGTEDNPVIVDGGLFVGGNSASLRENVAGSSAGDQTHIKIGSYVTIDNVFLGNNGENMIKYDGGDDFVRGEGVLRTFARTFKDPDNNDAQFSQMTLTDAGVFAKYMEGCAMKVKPNVVFESRANGDADNYKEYTTKFGSFYCGGNVGSIIVPGKITVNFNDKVIIYNKVVGGCNNANVYGDTGFNAEYLGGLLGDPDPAPAGSPDNAIGDKLELNFNGLKIQPMRWNTGHTALEWNTISSASGNPVDPVTSGATPESPVTSDDDDLDRRLKGGNIYGGCYNTGHVNGNVVININASIVDRKGEFAIFDQVEENEGEAILYGHDDYNITARRSGVLLDEQGMDVLGKALNVFGGGYGGDSEIWGSTTVNINKGYVFQVFGGGENGPIGNGTYNATTKELEYTYDPRYSCHVNLKGSMAGVYRGHAEDSDDMAEAEFIYGGSFEAPIAGNTIINLGNGRIFNSFAGSCNADILGHTETYIGRNGVDAQGKDVLGFPWIRDHVYGGNDLGGQILNTANFQGRVSSDLQAKLHKAENAESPDVVNASAYMEYIQGRVGYIFGGCYGDYDYTDSHYSKYTYSDGKSRKGFTKPRLDNAFVNFRPNNHARNELKRIFGAGQGSLKGFGVDSMQNRSYILVDIPQTVTKFQNVAVFGAGANCGLGMGADSVTVSKNLDKYSAIIDLFRGTVSNVYGGSFAEGFTRRTMLNVPNTSTISVNSLFGGAYGDDPMYPCDVYESHVNYHSANATVRGNIYGGNNNADRTLYAQVNIDVPVYNGKTDPKTGSKYMSTVYGAGFGEDTWAQYTEVNLERGAQVYEVYGGGHNGKVINRKSLLKWQKDLEEKGEELDLSMPGYNECGLDHPTLVHATRLGGKYHTNVHIHEGATVWNYAYGGGMGDSLKVKQGILGSGDVYGSTYIDLLGGTVVKDLYAAGTSGAVRDSLRVTADGFDYNGKHIDGFTASSTAYIEGGKVRNVYGGGWRGSVGEHAGKIDASYDDDIPGETHVIIGKTDGTTLTDGIPAIERNAYGGGEGGAVFGTANITLNNGYIGYQFFDSEPTDKTYPYTKVVHDDWTGYYQEKIVDETWKDADGNYIPNTNLENSGNIFGGGYIDNSSVDITNVEVYEGVVRNSVFGGGEIAAIGRGDVYGENDESPLRTLKGIYKAGKTKVSIYGGWVKRNVFAGGKGIDNLGRTGSLYTNGYVFGKTEVDVLGGEIGTDEGVALGYGNVFGGGDIGYVYSAFEYPDGSLGIGKQAGARYDDGDEGHYFKSKNGVYTDDNGNPVGGGEKYMTEDSKVLVEPHCKVLSDVTVNGHDYVAGDYVPTSDLNTLKDKTTDAATWGKLDVDGIIIHNAVFAGGNVSSGNDQVFANATTLFGNATASINDVYNRDLITIGTGHTGGLYGDGNLTFVDGYRELNITNYGTDYYHITDDITLAQYDILPARERAYYELKYRCLQECTDNEGTHYTVGSTIPQDELVVLFAGQTNIINADGTINEAYWKANGVVSRYAGRIMNTIQRADFCGVFGSRMVMKGAQDRVPEIVDYTNYTINRVREVSLNKKESTAGDTEAKHKMHGNYFGIYSNVNFLGALTSDVNYYNNKRVTDNVDASKYKSDVTIGGNTIPYGEASYQQWKQAHINDQTRNNGNSHNQVALASGVYLELTTEESTGNDLREKEWGYITGVVELDLINVQTGVGGGFVYAKNVHGNRQPSGKTRNTLTSLNDGAVSNRSFIYTTDDATQNAWQSSGNFVHSTQTIVDDCYDESAKYKGSDAVPAHYWFIKGSVYVYDQYISAYTGAPNAYSETVNIPLTISAASHGVMKLLNVKPNRYAYYSVFNTESQKKLTSDGKLVIKDVEYHLNDPISYWDWYLLPAAERNLFVEDTYVTIADCKYSSDATDIIPAGTVMLPSEYNEAKAAHAKVYHVEKQQEVDFDYIFRSSNNVSHDTGYLLTYNVNNPAVWNKYYTPLIGSSRDDKITLATYNDLTANEQAQYTDGPTYKPTANGLYGQRDYKITDIISKETYDTYQTAKTAHPEVIPATGQADFEPAFLITSYVETTKKDGTEQRLQVGAKLAESEYSPAAWAAMESNRDEAYVCTSSITLSKTSLIYNGQLMTEAERGALLADETLSAAIKEEITKYVVPAYYCSTPGMYGGDYYDNTKNYRALTAWSSMSNTDRANFKYNYDALDLLVDPTYGGAEGQKYQYDGYDSYSEGNKDKMIYSLEKPVDYTAVYHGDADTEYGLVNGKEYTRTEYEALPNEQRHYAPIGVSAAGDYYVVKDFFIVGETPYPVGTVISSNTYASLNDETKAAKIQTIKFTAADAGKTFYYCRENWSDHAIGEVINDVQYGALTNKQKGFTIHGVIPMETSTLYVSRNSDIFDLSKEKIITVVYEYNYEESDESGMHITPITERHVVNIHLQFKSGIPAVEDITKPGIVLPGTAVTLRTPTVTPGAYEVTGGGWELYEKVDDAESHTNGIEYYPGSDPLYWYQDGYYVAYYAQTYLGKTYSNHVPVTVANYHDLKKVMDDKEKHLHVDYPLNRLKRESKIYINDYSSSSQNGLDLLKDFYDLSLLTTPAEEGSRLAGHTLLDAHVKGGAELEFILHSNIDHASTSWTPIGSSECFGGNFHGDGYTISGLDHSLFDKLCGSVYNLGVTGSFTGAGVAESGSGYVENCWISTSATETKTAKPVFGTPTELTQDRPYRIVNCYYQEEDDATNKYANHTGTYGIPTRKNAQAFFNGEVAYDLNGFYLYKRYCDKEVASGLEYNYLTMNEDGTPSEPHTAYYGSNPSLCYAGYVESRYADGDFRYADGEIPSSTDDRLYTEIDAQNNTTVKFAPIWPDDYIFFGQTLTYGHDSDRDHEEQPAHINRSASLLSKGEQSNRVYRAPAYFGNKTMGVAHFNPMAYLVAYTKPKTASDTDLKPAYPGMTAIDFAGHNDANWNPGTVAGKFYSPLLDDAGLTGISTNGQTPNMLVYAPAAASTEGYANKQTYDVLTDHFAHEPVYANYDETSYSDNHSAYKRVASAIDQWGTVVGHLVQSNLTATNDHLLVDKQDFNCPISYTFAGGKRMWYQRNPDLFVGLNKGWETVSLPFTAELVSTQDKGEITHFYSGSRTIEGSNAKIGHEYWLREYEGIGTSPSGSPEGVITATFNYPDAVGDTKTVGNTFLWDYYYSKNTQLDANTDTYQTYYEEARNLPQYPLLTTAQPYIIGFPGKTYYEFDLSGDWTAENTAPTAPAKLDKQVISFVSEPEITIEVSDDELKASPVNGYKFMPNYMSKKVDGYLMNAEGGSFDVTPEGGAMTIPFRPYFIAASTNSAKGRKAIEHIVFDQEDSAFTFEDNNNPRKEEVGGELTFFVKKQLIGVTSSLQKATDVAIFNTSGLTIASFTIQPNETIETPLPTSGVYIIRAAGGKYNKKISVK